MGRYAQLICEDCHVLFWLGKAVFDGERVRYFKRGDGPVANSQTEIWNRALWKMMADHAGHSLRVVIENGVGYDQLEAGEWREIGGDGIDDISLSAYLKNWEG